MNIERRFHTLTLLPDGRGLAVGNGGEGFSQFPTSSAEIFDPATELWTPTGDMSTKRGFHMAGLLSNGKVLVLGGDVDVTPGGWLNSAELWDPLTGMWTQTGSLLSDRMVFTGQMLSDDKFLAIGGFTAAGIAASAEIWDPVLGLWTLTGSMAFPRSYHVSVALQDGRILVSGGTLIATAGSTEIYEPTTGTWSITGTAPIEMRRGTLTLLDDGRVLGTSNFGAAAIYDPATQIWTATPPPPFSRADHTATLLLDGSVLIAGGNAASLLFFPDLQTWEPVSDNLAIAIQPEAVRLLDGRVLIAGGGSSLTGGVNFRDAYLFTGSTGTVQPLSLDVVAPSALAVLNGTYEANPFTVTATLANNGSVAASDVDVSIFLPDGLSLAQGSFTQSLPSLLPGAEQAIVWNIKASGQLQDVTKTYFVRATPSNVAGRSVTAQITLPGDALTIDSVFPAAGGAGVVTVNINGGGFQEGAEVSLVRAGYLPIPARAVSAASDSFNLIAKFDFTDAVPGMWSVKVHNPSGNEASLTDGFTVEAGRRTELWLKIIGPPAFRAGKSTRFYVHYGNRGNVDANSMITITLPADLSWNLLPPTEILTQPELFPEFDFSWEGINWDDEPFFIERNGKVTIPVFLPIGANSSGYLSLAVTGGSDIEVSAAATSLSDGSQPSPGLIHIFGLHLFCSTEEIDTLDAEYRALFEQSENARLGNAPYTEVNDPEFRRLRGLALAKLALRNRCLGGTLARSVVEPFVSGVVWRGVRGLFSGVTDDAWRLIETGWDYFSAWRSQVVASFDPNDKFGPVGFGEERFVQGNVPLGYSVFFENLESATAAAQEVVVSDQLDADVLDLSTFDLGPITFGQTFVTPPPGLKQYTTAIDLRPTNNLIVSINAGLDMETGVVTWRFASLDTDTGLPTEDPFAGFLPPNVTSPEGQGNVLYTVEPKSDLSTGNEIRNQASIIFDINAPILTPEWHNTIDNNPSSSEMFFLTPTQSSADFEIVWAGDDIGAGVLDYTIFVSEDGGPFEPILTNTTDTFATFSGQPGSTYGFYSIARDQVGHVEAPKTVAEAVTQIVIETNEPPVADAGGPYTVDEGSTVGLSGSGTDVPADVLTYDWDLDNDGQFDDATGQTPDFDASLLDGPSVHTVSLRVTDDAGDSAVDSTTMTVDNVVPAVTVSGDSINEGETASVGVTFTDPGDPDTHTATINWGDGSGVVAVGAVSSPFTPTHVYADNGSFAVTVTVTDDDGDPGSDTATVDVASVAPTASLTNNGSVDEGQQAFVSFGDQLDPSSDDAASGFTYSYDFDNDGVFEIVDSPIPTVLVPLSLTSDGPATVDVLGRITDKDEGFTDYLTSFDVFNLDPLVAVAGGSFDEGSPATVGVVFTDPGTSDTHTASVDWGDGSPAEPLGAVTSPFEPDHVYADNGSFTVTVTITDDVGGLGSDSTTVEVANVDPSLDPISSHSVTIVDQLYIGPVVFDDRGTLDTHTATIDWGDTSPPEPIVVDEIPYGPPGSTSGNSGTVLGSHIFSESGLYTATVTLTDDDGGSDSRSFFVLVSGSRSLLQRALDNLGHHADESKHIGHARKKLESALDDDGWIDEVHAGLKKGQKIFSYAASAVAELEKALKDHRKNASGKNKDELSDETLEWIASALSDIEIAIVTLTDVRTDESAGLVAADSKKQKKVDSENRKALKNYEDGMDYVATGRLDKGIREFRKAWNHAAHAEKHAGN